MTTVEPTMKNPQLKQEVLIVDPFGKQRGYGIIEGITPDGIAVRCGKDHETTLFNPQGVRDFGRHYRECHITNDKEAIASQKRIDAELAKQREQERKDDEAFKQSAEYALASRLDWQSADHLTASRRWASLGKDKLETILGWLKDAGHNV